jgi:signal transduction histidine kinase/CheY-like chemotaxis protein
MGTDSKILVVDDDPRVLDVVAEYLVARGKEVLLADGGARALEIFREEHPPVAVIDYRMPEMDGLTLMGAIRSLRPQTEILIVTGEADLGSATEAARRGAFDYLQKPFDLEALGRRVDQALEHYQLVSAKEALLEELEQRVRARTAALDESQRRLFALFNGMSDPLLIVDETLTILGANEGAAAHAGAGAGPLVGQRCYRAVWGRDVPCADCPVVVTFATGRAALVATARDLGGIRGHREFELRSYPMGTPPGAAKEAVEHIRDVTDHRRAEEERRALEAQRKVDETLRMVGSLAAGAAHDFNTLLSIVKGSAQFLLEAIPAADPRRSDAERIDATVDRGRRLVEELMVLGGTRLTEAHSVSVAEVVEEMTTSIRHLLGDHVVLQVHAIAGLWRVRVDPEQIEQVVMNLVVNARDAIAAAGRPPRGGTLTVELANVEVGGTSDAADSAGPQPRQYVMVAVTDTGCGMTPDVQSRIFEPFFTTKAAGRGIGLGLATVSCIVKLYDGYVTCESEPGRGSTFRVYLPREKNE